jgi:hypothetical protein
MTTLFTDKIEDWVKAEQIFLEAVVKESTQEVIRLMKIPVMQGGNMPVDTSFLQNSLVGVKGTNIPQINPSADGKGGPQVGNTQGIETTIANWKPGESMSFGFIASYAARQNYGFTGTDSLGRNYNQSGRHFVELAVQQWPNIVQASQRKLAGNLVFT